QSGCSDRHRGDNRLGQRGDRVTGRRALLGVMLLAHGGHATALDARPAWIGGAGLGGLRLLRHARVEQRQQHREHSALAQARLDVDSAFVLSDYPPDYRQPQPAAVAAAAACAIDAEEALVDVLECLGRDAGAVVKHLYTYLLRFL